MPLLASIPRALPAIVVLGLVGAAACTSNQGGGGGGPVAGPQDTHCNGMPAQATSQAVCHLTASADAGTGGGTSGPTYGPTMDNSEADDDDCKYHVKWTSSPIGENRDVTFTVTVTTKTDGKPAGSGTGIGADANVIAEVFLNDTHPAPNTNQQSNETVPGTYAVGPIQFDAPGQWTVRFHFYEMCTDVSNESPHGHAAFFVQVP
jgi:hypothetical protein